MCSYWAMHVIKDLMQQPRYQSISKLLFSVRSHFMYSFLHCTGKAFPECSVENIVFNIFFSSYLIGITWVPISYYQFNCAFFVHLVTFLLMVKVALLVRGVRNQCVGLL